MPARAVRYRGGAAVEPFPWTPAPGGRDAGGTPGPPVDRAREAADTAAASERLAALERDAFVKGYAQGERSGADAAAREGEALLRRLAESLDEVASLRADLMRRSERELVRLAVAIAERVIRREVSLDRSLIVAMAKVAIDQLGDRAAATIRLHPADHAAFLAASEGQPFPGRVEIVADGAVSRGGCVVRSDVGSMDLDLASQLTEIAHGLLGPDDTPAAAGAPDA